MLGDHEVVSVRKTFLPPPKKFPPKKHHIARAYTSFSSCFDQTQPKPKLSQTALSLVLFTVLTKLIFLATKATKAEIAALTIATLLPSITKPRMKFLSC